VSVLVVLVVMLIVLMPRFRALMAPRLLLPFGATELEAYVNTTSRHLML